MAVPELNGIMRRALPGVLDEAGEPTVIEIAADNGGEIRIRTGRGKCKSISMAEIVRLITAKKDAKKNDAQGDPRFIPADMEHELMLDPDISDELQRQMLAVVYKYNENRSFAQRAKTYDQEVT